MQNYLCIQSSTTTDNGKSRTLVNAAVLASSRSTLDLAGAEPAAKWYRGDGSPSKQTSKKMVSQSRLYFALLATVATMAFWLGMWSNSVSNYEKFTLPKPLRAVLNVKESVSYPDLEGKINFFSLKNS